MNSTETILAIILLIMVGYAAKRVGLLKSEDSITLNKIVVNIAIPSLIFLAMYTANLSNMKPLIPITLICIVTGIISGLIVYIFSSAKGYSKKTKWSLVGTSTLFNSGFLGYPVILGVFGTEGLVRAVFYDMGSTLLFLSLGILFIIIFGGKYLNHPKNIAVPTTLGYHTGNSCKRLESRYWSHTIKRIKIL